MINALTLVIWVALTYVVYYGLVSLTNRIAGKFYELMSTNIQYRNFND